MTAGATVLGSVVITRHRAQAAADLSALAGAARLAAGEQSACAAVESVTHANAGTVAECAVDGLDVLVTVTATTVLSGWQVSARARAGPAQAP
ncbi:Rv3654c family TadE-like protein [Mycobacterium sp. C31M]